MKKGIRKWMSLVLVGAMTLSLAACGDKNTNVTTAPAGSEKESGQTSESESVKASETKTEQSENSTPVTLKFANYAVLESGYTEFWNGVKSKYEGEHKNVTLEYVTAPYGEIVNTIINMAAAGDKVDLIFGENSWVPDLMDSGLASPVDELLTKEFLDGFYPDVMKDYEREGKYYGLPMYISPFLLYYNKDILKQAGFDAPPKTYSEMMKIAEKISALKTADGNKIYAFGQTTASVPISGAALNAFIFTMGGRLLDDQGKLSIDNEGFKTACTLLQEMDEREYNPQNAKLKDLRNLFALGQLAMYYDQSWGFNGVSSINPEAKNFTASAAPLMNEDKGGKSMLQAHSLILVNNGEANAKELSAFVEYLISKDTLENYLQNVTPAYPATTQMKDLVVHPVLEGAKGSESNIQSQAFVPGISNLNLELASLAQALTVSDTELEQAIQDFTTKAESILK